MKSLLSVVATLAFVLAASAADKVDPALVGKKLSDFALGELISGPAVDLANTGGKAVVIDAWGVNCPPCLAGLPGMEALAKRNKGDTVFIGAESQNSTEEAVKAIIKKNKLSYTITKGPTKTGIPFNMLPHAFVFDTTGALIFSGNPAEKEFERAVAKAGKHGG